METEQTQSMVYWYNFNPPCTLNTTEIEESKEIWWKKSVIRLKKIWWKKISHQVIIAPISSFLQMKNRITFCIFQVFLGIIKI